MSYWGPCERQHLTDHAALRAIAAERGEQNAKWGEQNHPDGTGGLEARRLADEARATCQAAADAGAVTWLHILNEEVCEALAESDPAKLRDELVQVAAVAAAWIEALDRRAADTTSAPDAAADR